MPAFANTTLVTPPMVNAKMKPTAHSIGARSECRHYGEEDHRRAVGRDDRVPLLARCDNRAGRMLHCARIRIDSALPATPANTAKHKYRVPMSSWFVLHNQRTKNPGL